MRRRFPVARDRLLQYLKYGLPGASNLHRKIGRTLRGRHFFQRALFFITVAIVLSLCAAFTKYLYSALVDKLTGGNAILFAILNIGALAVVSILIGRVMVRAWITNRVMLLVASLAGCLTFIYGDLVQDGYSNWAASIGIRLEILLSLAKAQHTSR